MKNILIPLFLICTFYLSRGQQNEWISLGSPDTTSYSLAYVSSQGYLFAEIGVSREIIFSQDEGQTWESVSSQQEVFIDFFKLNSGFREDSQGNIFVMSGSRILRFDISQKKFIRLEKPNAIIDFLDFDIYEDGRLLILTDSEIKLYNSSGDLLNSRQFPRIFDGSLLHGKNTDKHYFAGFEDFNDQFIWEYSEDLTFLGNKNKINHQYYEIARSGNNIITNQSYSSDGGITWIRHAPGYFDPALSILPGHDNRLYLTGHDKIYISNDDGNNFSSFGLPSNTSYYITYVAGDATIYTQPADCNMHTMFNTKDSGLTWNSFKTNIGIPHCTEVYPGPNENLIVDNDCYQFLLKDSTDSIWNAIEIEFQNPTWGINDFVYQADGSVLAFADEKAAFKSTDQGKTWRKLPVIFDSFSPYLIKVIKNDILFVLDNNILNVSYDFGENFQKIDIDDPDLQWLIPELHYNNWAFSSHYDLFYHDIFENEILFYNYLTREKGIIKLPENYHIINPATLYSGSELFIMAVDWSTNEKFLIHTHDKGQTFSIKPVHLPDAENIYPGLWIDPFNNFYLADDEHVFISYDRGDVWNDITPRNLNISELHDMKVSYDRYIYMATTGAGVIKYANQLQNPGKIVVSVVRDDLENCTRDVGEEPVRLIRVQLNDNQIQPVNTVGEATFYTYKNTNEIKVLADTFLHEPCQDVYTLTIDSTTREARTDIPLKVRKDCAKPSVAMSVPFLRRCFDNTYHGTICNEGTATAENNTIQITLDTFFDFVSASLPVISFTDHVLTLDVKDLEPGECTRFALTINVRCTADLGQTHCIEAGFRTDTEICDQPQPRFSYRECRENIGAYDPNDKQIFVNGEQGRSYIEPGETIEYLIRFQNTGTDTAFTVRIEDPISAKFDITTLRPVAASHEYHWSLEGNVLEVVFPDIRLVDSFTNEPLSHGFVKFEIALKEGIERGDKLTNEAGIFFDFNLPIITNEVVTEYGKPTSVADPADPMALDILPNPAFEKFRIKQTDLFQNPAEIIISDMNGNIRLTKEISSWSEEVDIRFLPSGSYIVALRQNQRVSRVKLVKM